MTVQAEAESIGSGPRFPAEEFRPSRSLVRNAVLYLVFFSIAFTGGYQTLNRFDPRGTFNDSKSYYAMVQGDYAKAQLPYRYRMLVPALAGLVYRVIPAKSIGTWDPVFLSILLVNSMFTALTGLVLVQLGKVAAGNVRAGVTAAFLFVASWITVNETLAVAGIDTAPCLIMTSIILAVESSVWWLVPVLIAVGATTKETVVPFGIAFVCAWLLFTWRTKKTLPRWSLLCSGLGMVTGILALRAVWHLMGGEVYEGHTFHWSRITGIPAAVRLWFQHIVFIAWGPFLAIGLFRLHRLPRALIFGVAAVVCLGLFFGCYEPIAYNIGRLLFNHVGPVFALSSALFIEDLLPVAGNSVR